VNSQYTEIQIGPPLAEWPSFLTISSLDHSRLSELRRTARSRLVEAAEAFVLRLNAIADDTELATNTAPLLTGDPTTQPIVMTGHQPVQFHSGLSFKYETTQQFAAENNAIAVAVIIDTDRGDAGQFSYPDIGNLSPDHVADENIRPYQAVLAVDSLANSYNLFGHGKLRSAAEIKTLAERVCGNLRTLSQPNAADLAEKVFGDFGQLSTAKATAMEANTIMRWHYGIGSQMLELPLSAIASFPESLMLTVDILKQPGRFAAAYNSALALFREEHGIRNSANPFPDLKTDDEGCELPFWVVDHNLGSRQVLKVQVDGNVTRLLANGVTVDTLADNISDDALDPMLLQNLQIVPRGALITVFLRLLFSDLFVHGTGGGRYDRFTDEFIRTWWNAEPPPFTVASASRYLFDDQRGELQRLQKIKSQLRDLEFNPQRHFGQRVFSDGLEERLAMLVQKKTSAVSDMKSRKEAGESTKEARQQIQAMTNEIRDAVAAEFQPQLVVLNSLTPEQHDAINSRTYPWFFFAGSDSR
jgi:hypothetical protein